MSAALLLACCFALARAGEPPPSSPSPPFASEEHAALKSLIKEDLLAIRRARRALKKARLGTDLEARARAQAALEAAKARLKGHRLELRKAMGPPRRGGADGR